MIGWLLIACSGQAQPPPEVNVTQPAARPIVLKETTVGSLAGRRVPMANMLLEGNYALPDGSEATGVTATLVLPPPTKVGMGSQFDVGGQTFEVIAIEKTAGKLGTVTVQQVTKP